MKEHAWNKTIDGVRAKTATPDDLYTFEAAANALKHFKVPQLFDSNDYSSRVFFALFDGTGNHMGKDPDHTTNVGLLALQMQKIGSKDPHIACYYKEGPGTQVGIIGLADAASGSSFQKRTEAMYDKFGLQAEQWLKEDPACKISVVSLGFSRGAEQAAAFARLVDERGVQQISSKQVHEFDAGLRSKTTYSEPPLRPPGKIPQALALYDPVGTGAPGDFDRRPPPSVVTGIQIVARDEFREQFPSSRLIPQGISDDHRFVGITTAGAHSDIGGGYLINGLSNRNFNLMAKYLNGVMGDAYVKRLDEPIEAHKNVIHDTPWYFAKTHVRGVIDRIAGQDAYKGLPTQATDPLLKQAADEKMKLLGLLSVEQPADAATRHKVAQIFLSEPKEKVIEQWPHLKTAYAALDQVRDRIATLTVSPIKTTEMLDAARNQVAYGIRSGEVPLARAYEQEKVREVRTADYWRA